MTRSVLKYFCCTRFPPETAISKNSNRSVNITSVNINQKKPDAPLTKLNCRLCGITNVPEEKWCISCCSCTRCCTNGCIEYIADDSGLFLTLTLDNKSRVSELDRLDGLSC